MVQSPTRLSAYGVAIAAVLTAAGIRWSLTPLLGDQFPYITFFGAVVCAAWYGGAGPGFLATVLSFLFASFFFVSPANSPTLTMTGQVAGGLFLLVGGACVLLSESLHRIRRRALEAERRYRDVLGSLTDLFFTVDRDWRVTFANQPAAATVGHSAAALEGRLLWEIVPELAGTDIERELRMAMAEPGATRLESRSPISGRWLDVAIYPTGNGLAVQMRDISPLRQAEANARFIADASRILAGSLEISDTITRVADLLVPRLADWCFVDLVEADGRFHKVAVRCADPSRVPVLRELRENYVPDPAGRHPVLLAYRTRRPELVSPVSEAWLHSRARDARHLELLQGMELRSLMVVPLLARDQLVGLLTLATAESGRRYTDLDLRQAESLAVHIAQAVSNARLYQEAQTEIRERRAAEGALRESEGRFRTLVTATGAMVWRVADDGRALDEPAGWEQVTGQSPEELRADPSGWFSRVHPGDRERVGKTWMEARAARRMVDVEFRLRRRDGVFRRMHAVGVPLMSPAGEVLEWIGTTVDVTERRETEEQLHRAQRMEMAGRLVGGMAHETNNQMMVILNFVEFLLRGENLTEAQRADLAQLTEAAERVATLTRQLLALSRRQVLDSRALELDTVVLEAEPVIRRALGPEIRLSYQLEPGEKWVLADRTQLVQVVVNLALNAGDAISGGGEVTISTRRADIAPSGGRLGATFRPPGIALLSVADTGAGIEPPRLARIFEPFFTSRPSGQHSGLGLPVVEGIVSQSGGEIWVESKPGYGTVVSVGLPLTAERPVAEPVALPPAPRGSETILVVDDEEQIRRLLVRGLQLGNYTVIEASGAQEAIAILEQEQGGVHLVVTDIAMPDMSGVELAERIRAAWPGMGVVFVSGHPLEVVSRDRMEIAPGRFLQKPFKVDSILTVVRAALDGAA